MCRNIAFFAWISCGHLIFPGMGILVSPVINTTQKQFSAQKSPQDQSTSNSFNVLRGLYPPHSPISHPDHDYSFPHVPSQPQPQPQPQPVSHGCGIYSQPNIFVVPMSNQYQPRVKHTIKTVITDVKEVTTPLNDGSNIFNSNLNLSLNGATKSSSKEQEVQVVLPSLSEGYSDDDVDLDLPVFKGLNGFEPIEFEGNLGTQNFNPEKAFLFRPYGVFKPASAATLSAPHKPPPQVQPFSFQQPFNIPPFNLAYLRPRPLSLKEDTQQWRPSLEQPKYTVHARPGNVNVQKSSSNPCPESDKSVKEAKIDSKLDNIK